MKLLLMLLVLQSPVIRAKPNSQNIPAIEDDRTGTGVMYTNVTSGSSCERLTSKKECEEAARHLGLSDTEALEETTASWPPSCYLNKKYLFFNKKNNTTAECNSHDKVCICKKKSGKSNEKHEKGTTANKTITPDNKPDEQLEMGTTDNKTTTAHTKTNEKDDKGSFDNNGCCSKVFIDFVKDDPYRPSYKDPKTSKLYESFFVKEDDGKNVYKSETSSNKYAMWWKNGFWMVGHYENKNSYTALAFAKSYNYCPEKINYDWEYFSSLDGTFRRAEGGLSVYHKCKSDDD